MENLELYNNVRSVPEEAKKTIQGGRLRGFTEINPMWRIKTLTEQFGPCGFGWYIEEVEHWSETSGQLANAFVKVHLFVRIGEEWSRPIVGIGGSSLVVQEKNGLQFSDEAYKMAYTDAISVACKSLGIGADVYYEKDRTKYTIGFPAPPQQPVPQQPAPQPTRKEMSDKQLQQAIDKINEGKLDILDKCKATYALKDFQLHAMNEAVTNYKINNNIQ